MSGLKKYRGIIGVLALIGAQEALIRCLADQDILAALVSRSALSLVVATMALIVIRVILVVVVPIWGIYRIVRWSRPQLGPPPPEPR